MANPATMLRAAELRLMTSGMSMLEYGRALGIWAPPLSLDREFMAAGTSGRLRRVRG